MSKDTKRYALGTLIKGRQAATEGPSVGPALESANITIKSRIGYEATQMEL